jgi:hypothetical protein
MAVFFTMHCAAGSSEDCQTTTRVALQLAQQGPQTRQATAGKQVTKATKKSSGLKVQQPAASGEKASRLPQGLSKDDENNGWWQARPGSGVYRLS